MRVMENAAGSIINPDTTENRDIRFITVEGVDVTSELQLPDNLFKSVRKLNRVFEQVILSMKEIVAVRDSYTANHQQRVARLCLEIGKYLALPSSQLKGLQMAALIHDIGKLGIPSEILSKPGKLNPTELALIKAHPMIGYEMIKNIEFPWPIAKIVLQHHERMNGTGYPNKLRKDEITLEARILAVADVVEAMASHRPYRPALGLQIALEEIEQNQITLYDPNVVDACKMIFERDNYKL
jgi:HD-GYP domain-containing protein (c-di-GMP phosphodiesterase class II)